MFIHQECKFKFRSDTVSSAYEHRLGNTFEIELEQATESAHIGADTCCHRLCYMLFHEFNGFVSGCDVNAGSCVCVRFGLGIHGLLLSVPAVCAQFARVKSY